MNNKTILFGYACLILLGFMVVPAAIAAPVDCMGGVCSVSDGGASIATTSSSEKDLKDLFLNGTEHLGEDEYHICNGLSNSGDCEFPSASSATMDEVTNQIVVNFDVTSYTIRVTWTLDGSTPDQAIVDKQLVLMNTDEATVELTVLDYTGWNLFSDGTNDTAWFVAPDTLRQTQGDITADSIAVDAADFYAVYNCDLAVSNCEDIFDLGLTAGTGNLNNNAGPVGPYAEYSWQNNVSLPVSSSVTINRRLVITQDTPVPVPTLSAWALVLAALALLIYGAAYLRRT